MNSPAVRYHYMDNLRALAMLTGVFFHAAVAYSPMMQELWLAADPQSSVVLDWVAWFTHMFRMPLFFLIAGFFACFMVQRRGRVGYIKNRALRIGLPFVIFFPLCMVAVMGSVFWAMANVENASPMLDMIKGMAANPDAEQPPASTMHLWFLYNLMQFCLVYALLDKLGWLDGKLTTFLTSPRVLVFVVPLLIVPAFTSQPTPHPAPEQFEPKLWSFGLYGIFFLVGSRLFMRQEALDELRPYAPWLLVTGVAGYAYLHTTIPEFIPIELAMSFVGKSLPFSWLELGKSVVESFVAVHMTLVCLIAGKLFLDKANGVVRYIADSSYWVYIIHLPLLFQIQFWLLDVDANLWVKFAIASFGTLAIGIATYALLVRWTPIGWMLNGRRGKQAKKPAE